MKNKISWSRRGVVEHELQKVIPGSDNVIAFQQSNIKLLRKYKISRKREFTVKLQNLLSSLINNDAYMHINIDCTNHISDLSPKTYDFILLLPFASVKEYHIYDPVVKQHLQKNMPMTSLLLNNTQIQQKCISLYKNIFDIKKCLWFICLHLFLILK